MNTISIPAHFDGVHILLDEPHTLKPDTKRLVIVLSGKYEEREAWLNLSAQGLDAAYTDDEPDYPLTSIREINPHYDRR